MKCGLNGLNKRVLVQEEQKTENSSGGITPTDVDLFTVWGGVELTGSEVDESGARIVRTDVYEVVTRVSPMLDTKRAINKLKFVINGIGTIYPASFKVKNEMATFTCYYRHEN
jgi:DNA topoisomerase IB